MCLGDLIAGNSHITNDPVAGNCDDFQSKEVTIGGITYELHIPVIGELGAWSETW